MQLLAIIKHFMEDSTVQVKFHRHVMQMDNLDRNHKEVLDRVDELYQLFPEKSSINEAELKTYIRSKNPMRDVTHLHDTVDSAVNHTIGPEITMKLIEDLVERQMAAKAAAACSPIISNQQTGGWREKIDEITGEYDELINTFTKPDSLNDCELSFEQAMAYRATDSGIKWPLKVLNRCLGGVEPGLGLVIARPDTGKTSFILNCLAYFSVQIKRTGRPVVYCGNEEGIVGLKARTGVSLLGCTTEWGEQNPKAFGQQVSAKGGDCIRFHGGVKSVRDVETLLKRYEPLVIVADQIGKFVLPGKAKDGPQGLADIYGWFREKSQEYNTMVMGVAQADIKGHNQQWLNDTHINASKTDVPGELDWGIGVGYLIEPGMESVRFINIFKNKNKYGKKGRAQVSFDADRCRYTD